VSALAERSALVSHIHAADARGYLCASLGKQPFKFAFDLQGQFASWRDDQHERQVGPIKAAILIEHICRSGDAESDGFA